MFIPDPGSEFFSIPDPGSIFFSIPDPGSEFFPIPDPGSEFFPFRIRNFSIPDSGSEFFLPGSTSKNLSISTQKIVSALGNMIRVVHSGSRIRILIFNPSRIPDPWIKKAKTFGSERILIHNTGFTLFVGPIAHFFFFTLSKV
jgi:hypothetical protein